MLEQLQLSDLSIDLVRKRIKNVHLSVYPPTGRVRIAAPERMDLETIRSFAATKLPWIRRHQRKQRAQLREPKREYIERESHYLWGKRYLLKVIELEAAPRVELRHRQIRLHLRPGSAEAKRAQVLDAWYRAQLNEAIPPLLDRWQARIGVAAKECQVRKMKTKWGSCVPANAKILLNLELAKKPPECLDYLVAHELIHLIEPTHNDRFVELMTRFVPDWQERRKMLNQLPVSHREWAY